MRKLTILTLSIALLFAGTMSAQATVKHHAVGPTCAFTGVHVTHRVGRIHYSVCEFVFDRQQVRVAAVRLGPHMMLRPFGREGYSGRPSSILRANHALVGVNGDFVVQRPRARSTAHLWIRNGHRIYGGVHAAREFIETPTGAWIGHEGKIMKLHPHPTQAFGGFPMIVANGKNIGQLMCSPANCKRSCGRYHCDNPLFGPNPRTVVGVSHGCEDRKPLSPCVAYLVTVDGRQYRWSVGLRFPALGSLLVRLGAWTALNLDGGGSTEMWMRYPGWHMCQRFVAGGCLLDRPAYHSERTVVQSIGFSS